MGLKLHHEVARFIANHRPDVPGRVLDVGGRDINGTVRFLFLDSTSYTSVDLYDGPAVDIVGDICDLGLENAYETVICAEVLEHAPNWAGIVESCAKALVPGGYLVMTCAGPGRPPHSALDEAPIRPDEHYRNVSAVELEAAFDSAGIDPVLVQEVGLDTQGVGIKRAATHGP